MMMMFMKLLMMMTTKLCCLAGSGSVSGSGLLVGLPLRPLPRRLLHLASSSAPLRVFCCLPRLLDETVAMFSGQAAALIALILAHKS